MQGRELSTVRKWCSTGMLLFLSLGYIHNGAVFVFAVALACLVYVIVSCRDVALLRRANSYSSQRHPRWGRCYMESETLQELKEDFYGAIDDYLAKFVQETQF